LQWCFYYPAVIDPDELQFTADEQKIWPPRSPRIAAGDLLAALANYPAGPANISDNEKIYHAALLLSVGEVEKAGALCRHFNPVAAPARRRPAPNHRRRETAAVPSTHELSSFSTELLADSYYRTIARHPRNSLQNALELAQQAAKKSPKSGFAWERVAELEFSFGRTDKCARSDLDQSLALAPRNAQALALKGFLLAAQNQPREALLVV
jgi:Flp pilus assembly protein TadD